MHCYLITGGESTGTRMMVRSFYLLGIPEYEPRRNINWAYDPLALPDGSFVLHAGMPVGGRWYNLWEVGKRLRHEGYEIVPIVMTREWNAVAKSQVRRGYVNSVQDAYANLRSAYRQITQQLSNYVFVSYEQFCLERKYRQSLFAMWGLPEPPIDIHYGNSQYYQG